MPYNPDALPHASVKIYKDDTVYWECTYQMIKGGQPVIYKAMNRGGNFNFTIDNDPENSILLPTFDGWSDGSEGAVDWGMYVLIEDIQPDGTLKYVTDGYITTITPNAYEVKIECGDHLAMLGSMGADIHRNYYGEASFSSRFNAKTGGEPNEVLVDIRSLIESGGSVADPKYYMVKKRVNAQSGEVRSCYLWSGGGSLFEEFKLYCEWTTTATDVFSGINLPITSSDTYAFAGVDYTFEAILMTETREVIFQKTYNLHFNNGAQTINVDINFDKLFQPGKYILKINSISRTGSGVVHSVQTSMTSGENGSMYYVPSSGSKTYTTRAGGLNFNYKYVYDQKSMSGTVDGYNFVVSSIEDVSDISAIKADLISPSEGRAIITLYSGEVPVSDIMENIAERTGYLHETDTSQIPGTSPMVRFFRTGGGYALDYLQKLADVMADGNYTLSYSAKGQGENRTLYIGTAKSSSTFGSDYNVEYGNTENEAIMYEFTPTKTMKNRPSRALMKGTISGKTDTESTPVILTVHNYALSNRRGAIKTDSLYTDSSALDVNDMIQIAYQNVNYDEEDWEGTLTLSGIMPNLIESEGIFAGSGKVFSVTDPRYGFESKKFLIIATTIDYNKITTKCTLSNEPQAYSSSISESVTATYLITDKVITSTDSTSYNTQYIYVNTDDAQTVLESGNVISVVTGDNGTIDLTDNISFFRLPGNRTLAYGAVRVEPEGSAPASTNKYDVLEIVINGGTPITIPTNSNPDFYQNQYLIVNVEFPTT